MNKQEILERIEKIKEFSYDEEIAHQREDSLREDFIRMISIKSRMYGELAKIVLSTNSIKFSRWCS